MILSLKEVICKSGGGRFDSKLQRSNINKVVEVVLTLSCKEVIYKVVLILSCKEVIYKSGGGRFDSKLQRSNI